MAEPAGLAIGAVGLAGLFTTCVECIDYISLARNHGRDFETSMTKILLLKARLDAWGDSLQVLHEGKENAALRNRWLEEQDTVGRCLVGIKSIFEDDKQMESRYGLRLFSADQDIPMVQYEHKSRAFRQIEDIFKSRIQERQKNMAMSKKTRWAIHDKKRFDSMITDLAFLIGGLEDLSDRLHTSDLQRRLLGTNIESVTDTDSISMMEDASAQVQPSSLSQSPVNKGPGTGIGGHTYIGTMIKDRAKVLNGNFGIPNQSSHVYYGTQASNDAHVVQGDVSNEAGIAFFK